MKKILVVILCFLVLTACEVINQYGKPENFKYFSGKTSMKEIDIKQINDQQFIPVNDLISSVDGSFTYDRLHRTLKMEIDNQGYKLIYGIPVIERNGVYLPIDTVKLLEYEGEVYLPVHFLETVLGLDVSLLDAKVKFPWTNETLVVSTIESISILEKDWTVGEMIDYLSFLQKPLEDATVSTIPNHLPGAKRPYRNGFHEGIDWYAYASGQHISITTPVFGMADGVVVRADHDYVEYPSSEVRDQDLALTALVGETPEYIFDRLRGKQVWVQYENGVMNRFAHLYAIPENIKVGEKVTSSTVIGYVGNSGTSGAVNNDGTQLHLHQDILVYGEQFWKPFTLEETLQIVVGIFGK
nr:peptidoglycan DD-metalloendopeptidase family protein [Anaerobacillus sp. CMMVII]